ncbi:hypothetical protein G6F40_015059 [Rhizopus arrhizus]|nr:hypothetical protein G6F40_015059 [Rhizopus arrhizus]
MAPRVVPVGWLGVRPQPAAEAGRCGHQIVERSRQLAGVDLVIVDLGRDGLHVCLGDVGLSSIGAAQHAAGDQGQHRADQHDDDDDFQQAHARLVARGGEGKADRSTGSNHGRSFRLRSVGVA